MNHNKIKLKKTLKLIAKNKNKKIIDLGCKNGDVTYFLHKNGYNIEGIDIDSKAIKQAKKTYPKISFKTKNVFDVDFAKYDIMIALGLFEYILNLDDLIKKLEKEMKKSAVLIFSVPNACSFRKRLKCLSGENPDDEKAPHFTYTFKDIKNLIAPLNFRFKKITSLYLDGIKNIHFPTPKNLSGQIIVKMIK